jgi:uroporphyrinogen III methyltransferase/synthase
MDSGSGRPLNGYTILLTRPAGSGATLCEDLEGLGAIVEARPTIALVPPGDRTEVDRALSSLAEYDWLIFTSPRGVHFFFHMAAELHGAVPTVDARIASIGPSTALALEERALPPTVVADDSRAEGLARALEGRVGKGDRVLLVRPEKTRPLLEERLLSAGAEVDSVAFYRNVASSEVPEIVRDILAGRYDVIILTSPSTLERLREATSNAARDVDEAIGRTAVVTIGKVTARAVERAGLAVAGIAREPTVAGIREAVLELFEA